MNISFGFGKGTVTLDFNEKNIIGELHPNKVEYDLTGPDEVRRSLENPIGSDKLRNIVKKGQKIVIITSDITRPVPSYKIIPCILDELEGAGVDMKDVTVVFALGSHRFHTEEEKRKLVSDAVYDRVSCIDCDASDYINMGTTSKGTPVDIFRPVAEADIRICVGNIEYHYFAGYSGGAKAIMPGVSTRAAIQSNHKRMIYPEAAAGRIEGNPVREDIDEVANFCPVHFIVNVVLSEKKEIIHCVSGHYIEAHRAGCKFLDKMYKIDLPELADIVVVSPGGYPKDINMYQAQKALNNAQYAVRKGGIIVWIASCAEGLGEHTFEEWMLGHEKSSDMIDHIKREFKLGGHKAASIAMVLENVKIFLVSDLDPDFIRKVHLTPYATAKEAVDEAFKQLGSDAKVIAMPYGGATLPVHKGE